MQTFFAKAGSNSASKLKSLVFIEAHKQCAKILPTAFWFGVSADDEFLLLV